MAGYSYDSTADSYSFGICLVAIIRGEKDEVDSPVPCRLPPVDTEEGGEGRDGRRHRRPATQGEEK